MMLLTKPLGGYPFGATVYAGHCLNVLRSLEVGSVQMCITSPPYYVLRDYGLDGVEWPDGWIGCLGLEPTPQLYVQHLVDVFAEVWRVLADDGTLWLNLGDSYACQSGCNSTRGTPNTGQANVDRMTTEPIGNNNPPNGLKPKDLIGIPWRVAFALQDFGWYLRSDIIWHKSNCMPESVKDRPTKAHEYLFLLSKQGRYYYDADAIREPHTTQNLEYEMKKKSKWGHKKRETCKPNADEYKGDDTHSYSELGRNKRTVWTIPTTPYSGAHFAVFPPKLIEPCILAGSAKGDTVLDPFFGSGTTGLVALENGRHVVGIDASEEYCGLSRKRLSTIQPRMF